MKVLGIDIGGSGIKGAVVDTKKGQLHTKRLRIPTPQPATPGAVLTAVVSLIKEFDWNGPIGCGFPAAVKHETVMTASNIDKAWIGLNAAGQIKKVTGCPTHLVNDVDAAGLAEMKFGAGKKEKGVVMMIAVGTGIGTALFVQKKLVPNTELGFITLYGKPSEHYASNSVRKKEALSWEEWGKRFNEYLHRVESLFWPDLFILGGGLSKHFEHYSMHFDVATKVVAARAKNNAGIIGAALAARQKLK